MLTTSAPFVCLYAYFTYMPVQQLFDIHFSIAVGRVGVTVKKDIVLERLIVGCEVTRGVHLPIELQVREVFWFWHIVGIP